MQQVPSWLKRVESALKRTQPAGLRAHLADGTAQDIAISGARVKWAPALKLLSQMAWVRLDFLDTKGRLIHQEEAQAAAEVEDLGYSPSNFYREVRAQTMLMMQAQSAAMELLKPVLAGHERLVHDVLEMAQLYKDEAAERTEQLGTLAERFDKALTAKAGGDDDGALAQMAQVVDMLGKLQPVLGGFGFGGFGARRAAGPPAGAKNANGTNGTKVAG